jgi:hypothetical protein
MPPVRERILRAISTTPTTAKRLARLVNARYNSHFRQQLRELQQDGILIRQQGGYCRAS